ncbi:MAG: hypothetical protein H0V66_11045, partial [Bdellovibrionales bacterium]|nr:hypothetical protein [Bdellovibrionales bacterium]
ARIEQTPQVAVNGFAPKRVVTDATTKVIDPGGKLAISVPVTDVAPTYSVGQTLKVVQQKMTKMYVNAIKAVTKERANMTILAEGGIKLEVGAQLGKGSRGVVSDLTAYENLPKLKPEGEYVVKLAHTLKGQSSPLSGSVQSLNRELEIYDDVITNMPNIRASKHYPTDASWGDSMPLCKIHYSMKSPEGLVLIKDKIKGLSVDKFLAANGGKLTPAAEKSLKEVYALNQALYQKQKISVNGVTGQFSGDIAKANLMWIDDPASLKQLGYKRPGFVLLELDIHYKNGPKFIEGNMSFEEYMRYVISN